MVYPERKELQIGEIFEEHDGALKEHEEHLNDQQVVGSNLVSSSK